MGSHRQGESLLRLDPRQQNKASQLEVQAEQEQTWNVPG